jgi:hypothetical protein
MSFDEFFSTIQFRLGRQSKRPGAHAHASTGEHPLDGRFEVRPVDAMAGWVPLYQEVGLIGVQMGCIEHARQHRRT